MNHDPDTGGRSDARSDDPDTRALLRSAGPRLDVPVDRAARVRAQVHRHWQAGVRRRAARRRLVVVATLGSLAALLVLIATPWVPFSRSSGPAPAVARVERIDGLVRAGEVGAARVEMRVLDVAGTLREGEALATAASSRVALRLTSAVSLRLDTGSEVVLHSPTLLELRAGALYVDSGEDRPGVEIRTPWGIARDIGTQFEVRVSREAMRVRVRTGLVELQREDRSISARPGTELTVMEDEIVSAAVAPYGAEWDWVVDVAPLADIDGQPLTGFLERVASELGLRLRYADPSLAAEARDIVLHGSIAGLTVPDALAVALTTSGLVHRLEGGSLVVLRSTDDTSSEAR